MTAKFYIISLGPGHPELITIQALKALHDCSTVFVQTRSKIGEWKGSIAYNILKKIHETHEKWFSNYSETFDFIKTWEEKFIPIHTPMNFSVEAWQSQVEAIADICKKHSKVGYVTLGDAGVFSSAYYLLDIINEKYPEIYENTEVIPGITSFSYASAKVKKPVCLGDSKLEVIPMHADNYSSTKVYMRLHKGDDMRELKGNDLYYFENLGLDNEAYNKGIPETIENYLTVIVDFADQKLPTPKNNKEK